MVVVVMMTMIACVLGNQQMDGLFSGLFGGAGDGECRFKCGVGLVAVERPNHRPSSNGCGSGGFKLDVAKYPGVEACCHEHDVAYDTCGVERDVADRQFSKCLSNACAKQGNLRKECESTIQMMNMGAALLGCKPYLDSQRNACQCVPPIAKNKKKEL